LTSLSLSLHNADMECTQHSYQQGN
jgi:hypothetical protein